MRSSPIRPFVVLCGLIASAASAGCDQVGNDVDGGPPDMSGCPSAYTSAIQIQLEVNWMGAVALTAGNGKLYLWSRATFAANGGMVSAPCGALLPVFRTSSAAGDRSVLIEFPDTAWDDGPMASFQGTTTRSGSSTLSLDPGAGLIGLSFDASPSTPWPAHAADISSVDFDGDGNPGISAIPRRDATYQAPPPSLDQRAADQLYLAIRHVVTLTASVVGCPDSFSGGVAVSHLDSHVLGCHIVDAAACDDAERDFLDQNRPIYQVTSGSFTAKRIADGASCAATRAALPAD